MKIIRVVLASILLFLNRLFPAKIEIVRSEELQRKVDGETQSLALYELMGCPFCIKVRRAAKRLGLKIETRNIKENKAFETELVQKGGMYQAPCLRIVKGHGKIHLDSFGFQLKKKMAR